MPAVFLLVNIGARCDLIDRTKSTMSSSVIDGHDANDGGGEITRPV